MGDRINDGGPAFPCDELVERIDGKLSGAPVTSHGMSLRDWFAGQALAGLCANHLWNESTWQDMASDAFDAADAMLAAREAK